MKPSKHIFLQISSTPESLIALLVTLPAYMLIVLGTDMITQGAAYALYALIPVVLYKNNQPITLSKRFLMVWGIFLSAWLIPNLYLMSTHSLESYLIDKKVLAFHALALSVVVVSFVSWQKTQNQRARDEFFRTMFLLTAPLIVLMGFKILTTFVMNPEARVLVFGYAHLNAEILLIGLFLSAFAGSVKFKAVWALFIMTCLIAIQTRSGLIAALIYLGAVYGQRSWFKVTLQKILIATLVAALVVIFWQQIFIALDAVFYFAHPGRNLESGFTSRTLIWEIALQEIGKNPWTGIGFFVRPDPWWQPDNPNLHVHNAFLRVWVENGTVLFTLMVGIISMAVYRVLAHKLLWEAAVLFSILFYYFFYPRHLTLNPMSILLYLILIRALVVKKR